MSEITNAQAELLESFVDDMDARLYSDYSGHGMFGRECVGIVCDTPISFMMRLIKALLDEQTDIATELADVLLDNEVSTDSMGLSAIVYWPHLSIAD